MSVKRSRFEVYLDVLKTIAAGVNKPTRVMYRANLSWNTLEDALTYLKGKGFIFMVMVGNNRRYNISPKGTEALVNAKGLDELRFLDG